MTGSGLAIGRMTARLITAIVGGYAATAGTTSLFARLAPIDRAEATIWAMVFSFLIYAGLILWAFHERRLVRVAAVIWGAAAASAGCALLLGPAL